MFDKPIVQKTISMLGIPDGVAREPKLLREARHPRVVEVWEAHWDPDPKWKGLEAITFVCPYYEGGSVYAALMDAHEFSLSDVINITRQVLDALAYLHEDLGYLHRDVKPGNVLLEAGRRAGCLGDLGSAGRLDPVTRYADNYGGTSLYLASEATPTGQVTVRSDLYSLGMTVIEMVSGRFSYETIDGDNVDARLADGRRALPDRCYGLPPHVPPPLGRLIRSLTHVDPSKRPRSAEAAVRKLDELQVVDWRRTSGSGLTGTWVGTWPPTKLYEHRRTIEITAKQVTKGLRSGTTYLTARWHAPGQGWRNHKKLDYYSNAGDSAALARFFRAVEAETHASPA